MLSRNTKQYAKTMTYKQCGQVEGIKFLFACKYFICFLNKKRKKERVDGAKRVLRVTFVRPLDDLQLNAGCY